MVLRGRLINMKAGSSWTHSKRAASGSPAGGLTADWAAARLEAAGPTTGLSTAAGPTAAKLAAGAHTAGAAASGPAAGGLTAAWAAAWRWCVSRRCFLFVCHIYAPQRASTT